MKKAVLIIDMPKHCSECKFLNDNYDYPECIITGETKGYNFRVRERKMDKCPLRPMPDKMNEGGTWTMSGYIADEFPNGWNACIEEILG